MNNIKFRAWHKELKKMYIVDRLFSSEYGELSAVGVARPCDINLLILDLNEIELMQWTGLWDYAGTEIFENDIVEMYDDVDFEDFAYRRIAFTCIGVNPEIFEPWDRSPGLFGKVIGNVYENSELLTTERKNES